MLAFLGFATITVFLVLIISRKISVITALVLVPLIFGFIGGFSFIELGKVILDGIKQVAPTGIMLIFAVLYFAIMLDAGLFDNIISSIIKLVKGDPLKVIMGTALITMLVHLDGDGTATFMIVISAFLPLYKRMNINRLILTGVVALAVGPMHLVPWSGTSARAIATLNTDAAHLFNPNIPSIIGGLAWVLLVAWILGTRERKRIGIIDLKYDHHSSLTEEQRILRRPRLVIVNTILTILLIIVLMTGIIPSPSLFILAGTLALLINYPRLSDQQKIFKTHGANIFLVSSMIFAAGVFSGILSGTGMVSAMANSLVSLLPEKHAGLLPLITAVTSMPCSLLFTPDAYYFGIVPVLADVARQFNINHLEIGRAALLGQMTVGFPLSPLTASTFLLVGLADVDLGDHQKFTFKWAFGTTIVMTIIAVISKSITI
ncbi:MAG: citrate:proton symporter [Bacteroidota bacterium]